MQVDEPHFALFFPDFPFVTQKDTVPFASYLHFWEMIKSEVQFTFSRSTT